MKILRKLRIELIAGVLALLISVFFAAHVLNFAHRNESERIVATALPFWQTLEAFEYRLYDARFVSRGKRLPSSHDRIAIVGVDENTLTNLSSWPLPRALHAQLIRRLKAAGARVISLDFDISTPQNPRDDAALESATEAAGNVLLVSYLTPERKRSEGGSDSALVFRFTGPLERFDQWTPDLSLAYVPIDSDGRVRNYPLYATINDATVGSLAALSCAAYQKILDGNENKKYEKLLKDHQWLPLQRGVLPVPVAASRDIQNIQSNAPLSYSFPLHFYGPQKTFATHSYIDALKEYSPREMQEKFGGKIVFVGVTTHFLKDVFQTPAFNFDDAGNDDAGNRDIEIAEMPGVELHATATAMLLDGTYIRTQSTPAALWTLFGLTIGASLWAASLRHFVSQLARNAQVLWTKAKLPGQIHTLLWFGLYLFLGALPIVLFWIYCNKAFQNQNLWIIAAYPLLSASSATAGVLLMLFGVESGTRRKTETLFSRAASPELLAKMLASGQDYLKPEVVCITVLFSDLEGFTTYSESHSPEEVIEVTNDFLSSVVPIIHKHDGWVDKYIGDAIMANFGALNSQHDHAEAALKCAVEIQDEAARWRKKTGIPFYMRVGIHTGEVIVAYMGSRESEGSRERMDYTVIGDTVNLASRLEGKNKEFGSWIMCSAETFQAAPNVVSAHSVSASIKGKSKEVEVFIVTGLENEPERDKNWAKDAA